MSAADAVLEPLRRAKHAAFVARRAAVRALRPAHRALSLRLRGDVPFRWDPELWPGTDQHGHVPAVPTDPEPAERRIFCFWTGDNDLTPNRAASVAGITAMQTGIDAVLVTPANLHEWVLPDFPLHPAYPSLSFVHRSDYLRSYFMHHHGGGYTDIKASRQHWGPAFDTLAGDPGLLAIGYREFSPEFVADPGGPRSTALRRNYFRVPGNCAFVFRPRTDLTERWHASTNAVLDAKLDALRAHPGGIWGDSPGYPLAWRELLGDVMQPWLLVFNAMIGFDDRLVPDLRMDHYR